MTAEEFTEHNKLTAKLHVGMKMTAFVMDCPELRLFYNQEPVSKTFGVTLEYLYPNYSPDLEYIDSYHLDKAAEMRLYLI